jgi:hypothetical protein
MKYLLKHSIYIAIVIVVRTFAFGQGVKLASSKHGFDLVYGDLSKEVIIDNVKFDSGRDGKTDILRIDHACLVSGSISPLIISSREPIPVDSLGLFRIKIQEDSLKLLLRIIRVNDTKISKRPSIHSGPGLFRVTYRSERNINQYYTIDVRSSTSLLKKIEQKLINSSDKEILRTFYSFLGSSGLLKYSPDGRDKWRY